MAMSPMATPADAAMRSTVVPTTPVNEEVAVPSAYGRSLAALESTMARRTRRYRNLVVCIVGLIPLAIAVSMFSAASGALVAAVLAVSACSLFAMLDGRGVERWRRGILDDWVAGALDLPAFASMVRALDTLPSTTTETMLATLPSIDDGLGRGALSTATRQMVFLVSRRLDALERRSLACRVMSITTATLSLAVAASLLLAGTTGRVPAVLILGASAAAGCAALSRLDASLARLHVMRVLEAGRHDTDFERGRFVAIWSTASRRSFRARTGARLRDLLTDEST